MVIEENEKANYLAHFKTKGAKNGIRRFQSYMVAPNPSGATGVEIGEAAEQRARIHGEGDDNQQQTYKSAKELRKEARRQKRLQKIASKRKKKELGDKEKWSKSYRELRKHSDAFTNEELRRAIERLELEDRITGASLNSVRDKTQKGADILKNLDSAGRSMAGIYNTVAGGLNVYHEITGKGQKLPKFHGGNESIQVKKPNNNNSNNNRNNRNNQNNNSQRTDNNRTQNNNSQRTNSNDTQDNKSQQHQNNLRRIGQHRFDPNKVNLKGDSYEWNITKPDNTIYSFNNGEYLKKRYRNRLRLDSLGDLGPYLEHFGVPGQRWYHRFFQSYKTAPTRSGKVGEEHGLANAQSERVGEEEASDNSWETKTKILSKNGFKPIDSDKDYYSKEKLDLKTMNKVNAVVGEHGGDRENERSTKEIEDFVAFHDDLYKNWKEKREKIIDTYVDIMFNKDSSGYSLPWMFDDLGDGKYNQQWYDGTNGYQNKTVTKEKAMEITKRYLRAMDVTVEPNCPGYVNVAFEGTTSMQTMDLWGDHSIDLEGLNMKELNSKTKYLSING